MHLRKLITTVGAIAAAGVMVLVPTAAHAIPSDIDVNGSTASGTVALTGALTSASGNVGGIPVSCTSGTIGGVVNRGAYSGSPADAFSFNSMNLSCNSFIPGTTVSMAATCNIGVEFPNQTTSNALTDTVNGRAKMTNGSGAHCVRVTVSPLGCTIDVGGTAGIAFDEANQRLTMTSTTGGPNTLRMYNPTGLCAAFITSGTPFALTAVFDTTAGAANTPGINFLA